MAIPVSNLATPQWICHLRTVKAFSRNIRIFIIKGRFVVIALCFWVLAKCRTKTMFSHLTGWRVNVALIQENASKELLGILEKCEGTKVLKKIYCVVLSMMACCYRSIVHWQAIVWDDALSGPVGLITKYALLKERGVVKMLQLRSGPLPAVDVRHIIFITRPNPKLMEFVADNVHSCEKRHTQGARKEFHLYFVPRISMLCDKHLKIRGVHGSFTNIGEFGCNFFPVDSDILSMELKDAYKWVRITQLMWDWLFAWLIFSQGNPHWRRSDKRSFGGERFGFHTEALRPDSESEWNRFSGARCVAID